jgi:hypothetical protein
MESDYHPCSETDLRNPWSLSHTGRKEVCLGEIQNGRECEQLSCGG